MTDIKKPLNELISELVKQPNIPPCTITGLTLDSRDAKPGDLFFAYPGTQTDGRKFINDVCNKGVAAVITELDETAEIQYQNNIPVIPLAHVSKHLGNIAAKFYDNPSQSMKVIGITGTNGKTSCCHYLAQALQQQNHKCGVVGTVGSGIYGELQSGLHTTPDAISLQKQFYEFNQQGVEHVVMEVSSHALAQSRTNGTAFDIAVFTNLSHDHLDYHKTWQDYGNAKQKLFSSPKLKYAVINIDDPYSKSIIDNIPESVQIITYGLEKSAYDFTHVLAHAIKFNDKQIHFHIDSAWGSGEIESELIGKFNVSNVLATIANLNLMGVAWNDCLQMASKLQTVPGRMQKFAGDGQPLIVVDYSHTPDALEKALQALAEIKRKHLWCVFGCGGNRDRTKRAKMGTIAEQYSDNVVLTNDNPRDEQPQQIVSDILKGCQKPQQIKVELDRAKAIEYAITNADADDIILIAGKGHEDYQEIKGVRYPLSDGAIVKSLLEEQ